MSTFREYLEESDPFKYLDKYEGGKKQASADFGAKAVKSLKTPIVVTTNNVGELEDLADFNSKQFAEYRKEIEKQGGKIELVEGRDEAKQIRADLKSELKLTNRDVSVKASYGGYSSSVDVSVKSMKALVLFNKIKDIGMSKESYQRDERSGEILSGGNTFINVSIDWKFEQSLNGLIQDEFYKIKDSVSNTKPGKLFNKFNLNKTNGEFWLSIKGSHSMMNIANDESVGKSLIHFIRNKLEDPSLFKYIK